MSNNNFENSQGGEPSKDQLQRQMEATREQLAQTVDEIKQTVEEQYVAARETITGVLDYREEFSREPLVWSLGALSAGFALGYTMGYAHKKTKGSGKSSEIAAFANSLVDELSTVGNNMVMPSLNLKIQKLFGVDFSELLAEIGSKEKRGKSKRIRSVPAKKRVTAKKSKSKKKT